MGDIWRITKPPDANSKGANMARDGALRLGGVGNEGGDLGAGDGVETGEELEGCVSDE